MLLSAPRRIATTFGAAFVVLVFGAIVYRSTRQLSAANALVWHTHKVIETVEIISARLTDAETGQRGYILTGEDQYLDPYHNAFEDVERAVTSLRQLTTGNARQRQRLDTLGRLIAKRFSMLEEVLDLRRTQGFDAAQRGVRSGRGKRVMDEIQGVLTAMEGEERRVLGARHAVEMRRANLALAIIGVGTLLAFALAAISNVTLARAFADQQRRNDQLEEQAIELEESADELRAANEHLEAFSAELERRTFEAIGASETAHAAEHRYRSLVDGLSVGVVLMDKDGFQEANPSAGRILGLTEDEIRGRSSLDPRWRTVHEDMSPFPGETHPVMVSMRTGEPRSGIVMGVHWPDDTLVWIEVNSQPLFRAGEAAPYATVASFVDITERKRAEERLQHDQEFLRALLDNLTEGIVACDAEGILTVFNRSTREFHGLPESPLPPERWAEHYDLYQADGKTPMPTEQIPLFRALQGESVRNAEMVIAPKSGQPRTVIASGQPILNSEGRKLGAVVAMHDVTERKTLEDQLRQSQKMDAVGQLAGGIAHDFNNLLTVIKCYSDLLLGELEPDDRRREDVEEIKRAGDRAAALTGQLLAFSRKQILQPRVLDLNVVVADMEKMLRRLIGADIELVSVLDSTRCCHVEADPGQIEQVLLNLVVNARDAMPDGGRITIETANVELSEDYARRHASVEPGSYVMLAVSDTGCGIDLETQARVFEPFFTTKERGKGTGLGLSTVYGIVKQSGGHVWLYSEPGHGTTFKIYLRSQQESAELPGSNGASAEDSQGSETVLFVEDEEALRPLIRRVLEKNGYTVLEAGHGREALRICETHRGPIHLVVTDVVMPEMGGRALVTQLQALRPEAKVLFMSGYTDGDIGHRGVLDPGIAFLQKPFTPDGLARAVRDVLGEHNGQRPRRATRRARAGGKTR